jgi:hypothetical protein
MCQWQLPRLVQVCSVAPSKYRAASAAKALVHCSSIGGRQLNIRPGAVDDKFDVGFVAVDHEFADVDPPNPIEFSAKCPTNGVRENVNELKPHIDIR